MSLLGDLAVRISAQVEPFLQDMEKVSGAVDRSMTEVEKRFDGLDALGGKMSNLGGTLSLAFTAPALALGGLGVQAFGEMESISKGLAVVEGGAEAAATRLESLKEVAKLPGLGLEEAAQGYIRLKAVGVGAEEAEGYMMAFGNALATVGKGRADLDAVVTQLVQMSSKSKVVAEDLKPIMERVPQVAAITKEAFGTIDTEVLQKAGISTQEYIKTIITELEKLPPVAGGMKNALENLGDTGSQALARIGATLEPMITAAIPHLESFINWVADLAGKFADLPAPLQAAIGVIAGLAAALGPVLLIAGQITGAITTLMPVLTGLGTFFGVSVTALAGWAVAIAAVLAALVALGVWVYDNWDSIAAVLTQAWDGITEIWGAVWNTITGWITGLWQGIADAATAVFGVLEAYFPGLWDGIKVVTETVWNAITGFLCGIWDGIHTAAVTVWGVIAGALEGVWNGIKSVASSIWGGIVSVFQGFLEWAAKIPGAAKLMNLDEAWQSASKAKDELAKTTEETKKLTGAADKAEKPVQGLATALLAKKEAAAKAKKEAAKLTKEAEKLQRDFAKLHTVTRDVEKSNTDLALTFGKAHEKMRQEGQKTVDILVPESERIPKPIRDAIKANEDLEAAYKRLGITSTAELTRHATQATTDYETIKASGRSSAAHIEAAFVKMGEAIKAAGTDATAKLESAYNTLGITSSQKFADKATAAKKAYDTIRSDGQASARDLDLAWVAYEDARIAAARAAGIEIPKEQLTALEKMKTQLDTKLGEKKAKWSDWSKQVSTITTDLSKDLGDILFEGDLSWGQKGMKALDSLGQAVSRAFVEPATKAIGDLIAGALTDLIGGKGFGGVLDRITSIGDSVSKAFGGGASTAAGGVSTGGGGAGAAAGAAGSGVAATVSAVTGVISAISDVIGNFQMAKMETTMNAVEHNTRYTMMYVGERADGGILGVLFRVLDQVSFGYTAKASERIRDLAIDAGHVLASIDDTLGWMLRKLEDAAAPTYWGSVATRKIEATTDMMSQLLQTAGSDLGQIRQNITSAGNWTVNFTGDPIARLVADQVMQQLRAQGVKLV